MNTPRRSCLHRIFPDREVNVFLALLESLERLLMLTEVFKPEMSR